MTMRPRSSSSWTRIGRTSMIRAPEWWSFVILGVLMAISQTLEMLSGAAGSKWFGGTRWGAVRKSTFEHQAKATTRISFVPQAQSNAQAELRIVTREMIQNADSTLFAGLGSSGAGLGVLAAVGAGMAASGGVLADTLADHGDRVDIYQRDGEGMVNALLVPAVTQWMVVEGCRRLMHAYREDPEVRAQLRLMDEHVARLRDAVQHSLGDLVARRRLSVDPAHLLSWYESQLRRT